MKQLFLLLVSLAFSTTLLAQATASTNQTIGAQNVSTLELDLASDHIEIRETKGSRLIVEAHITVEGVNNPTLLEYIVKSGRYELTNVADASTQTLTLTRKTSTDVLVVKGVSCAETIRYIVLVPNTIKNVKTHSSSTPAQ